MFRRETEDVWLKRQVEILLRDESKPSMKHKGTPLLHSILANCKLLQTSGYINNQITVCVKRLLKRGLDMKQVDREGRSALQLAAAAGIRDAYRLLAEQPNSDFAHIDGSGRNILHHAVRSESYAIVADVLRRLDKETFLRLITAQDKFGATALETATTAAAPADLTVLMAKAETKAQLSLHPDMARFATTSASGSRPDSPQKPKTAPAQLAPKTSAGLSLGKSRQGSNPFVVGKGVVRARKRFLNVLGVFHDKK